MPSTTGTTTESDALDSVRQMLERMQQQTPIHLPLTSLVEETRQHIATMPQNIAEMAPPAIETVLGEMIRSEGCVRVWGSTARQRVFYPLVQMSKDENDIFTLTGMVNGRYSILTDKLSHASVILTPRTTMTRNERESQQSATLEMISNLREGRQSFSLTGNGERIVLRRIRDYSPRDTTVRVSVYFYGSDSSHIFTIPYTVQISRVSNTARPEGTIDEQIAQTERICMATPEKASVPNEYLTILTPTDAIAFCHNHRFGFRATKKDTTEIIAYGIGPVDNEQVSVYDNNSDNAAHVRLSDISFLSIETNIGGHSQTTETRKEVLTIARNRGKKVLVYGNGNTHGAEKLNGKTIDRIVSIKPFFGEKNDSVVSCFIEGSSEYVSFPLSYCEYLLLLNEDVTGGAIATEQDMLTSFAEEIAALKKSLADVQNQNFAKKDIERKRSLARESWAAKKAIYGEDSMEAAVAKAEYEWINAHFIRNS